jgi:hypothetical protein
MLVRLGVLLASFNRALLARLWLPSRWPRSPSALARRWPRPAP